MLRNFLTENQFAFEEVKVQDNPMMLRKVIRKTGKKTVPQAEVNGKWIVGFDPEAIINATGG